MAAAVRVAKSSPCPRLAESRPHLPWTGAAWTGADGQLQSRPPAAVGPPSCRSFGSVYAPIPATSALAVCSMRREPNVINRSLQRANNQALSFLESHCPTATRERRKRERTGPRDKNVERYTEERLADVEENLRKKTVC